MLQRNLVAAATAVGVLAGTSWAEPTVTFTKGPGTTNGGIYIADAEGFGVFETFCLEVGEPLSMGPTFEYTISTDIMFQGNNTVNPLDEETAWLYTQFRQGDIPDLLDEPMIPIDELADAVQMAIWSLEDARATDNEDALTLVQLAEDAVNGGQWDGLGLVRVMNVWDPGHVGDPAHAKQDVLVLIPAPSTLAAAVFGVLGLASRRRR